MYGLGVKPGSKLKQWNLYLTDQQMKALDEFAKSLGAFSKQRLAVTALMLGLQTMKEGKPSELLDWMKEWS